MWFANGHQREVAASNRIGALYSLQLVFAARILISSGALPWDSYRLPDWPYPASMMDSVVKFLGWPVGGPSPRKHSCDSWISCRRSARICACWQHRFDQDSLYFLDPGVPRWHASNQARLTDIPSSSHSHKAATRQPDQVQLQQAPRVDDSKGTDHQYWGPCFWWPIQMTECYWPNHSHCQWLWRKFLRLDHPSSWPSDNVSWLYGLL